MKLFPDVEKRSCTARIKLVVGRHKTVFEYLRGVPVPKKLPLDRQARWVVCDKEHGHLADGSSVLAFHTAAATFLGVKLTHAWTDAASDGEVDITKRWDELKG